MKKIVPLLCYFCIKCVNFEKTVYKQENKVYNIFVKNEIARNCKSRYFYYAILLIHFPYMNTPVSNFTGVFCLK